MDNITKEFFIEICDDTKLEALTKSVLLNILTVAEKNFAKSFYMCIRKTLPKKTFDTVVKSFMFLGFVKLTAVEQKRISMTQTHELLKYTFTGEYDYE